MKSSQTIKHPIQKHILQVLTRQKRARFRDMRPLKSDTNLYAYHLKLLQTNNLLKKIDNYYTLTEKGAIHVDHYDVETGRMRTQPTTIILFVVQNTDGDVLLYKRPHQPFIDQLNLPQGKVHIQDESMYAAAQREISQKMAFGGSDTLEHAGDCYIRLTDNAEVVMSTFAHVFRVQSDASLKNDDLVWVRPYKLDQYDLAPAVSSIISRTFFRDPYFIEEFTEQLAI